MSSTPTQRNRARYVYPVLNAWKMSRRPINPPPSPIYLFLPKDMETNTKPILVRWEKEELVTEEGFRAERLEDMGSKGLRADTAPLLRSRAAEGERCSFKNLEFPVRLEILQVSDPARCLARTDTLYWPFSHARHRGKDPRGTIHRLSQRLRAPGPWESHEVSLRDHTLPFPEIHCL